MNKDSGRINLSTINRRNQSGDSPDKHKHHNISNQEGMPNSEETICSLIARQTRAYPQRVAIMDGETEISYQQLTHRSNAIAAQLLTRGVESGSLVGVCMNRSWELVAALMGVQRAGCAYVPLDPAYPSERVRYMLENSRAAAAIVDTPDAASLCGTARNLIKLGELNGDTTVEVTAPSAGDPAYVIYTSGSTGQPKGVVVEHRSVAAMSHVMGGLLSDAELSGMLAAASVCFDTSVMEIFGTLSLGGTIIWANSALDLPKLPHADKVRTCVMVPSAMQALLSSEKLPAHIQCVIFGGEALKLPLVKQIRGIESVSRVLNAYGPTEDTVFSTINEIPPAAEVVTIGKSVPGSRTYILDEDMRPVSAGMAGELYLAGNQLARGYLYEEAMTKARFVEIIPNDTIPESRLYRTGDLCRWTQNGEIEFLGRVDQQVKIRGYRIELGEIESALESMPGVDAAAAAALDGGIGQKILTAYVVSQDERVTHATVKAFLAQRLPKYMVPQFVMHLDSLPLLPNDKLDRKRLPCFEEVQHSTQTDIPDLAGNESGRAQPSALSIIQRQVASLLQIGDPDQIAPNRSFDSLGLDSLTSLELAGRLSKTLGQTLPSKAIFEYPTPAALAQHIHNPMNAGSGLEPTQGSHRSASDSLANFQMHIQSSHPTFQAAKANAWCATDKGKLVQEVLRMVNNDRRNPYSKVIRTGSASRGTVTDAYTDEVQEAIIWTTNLYLGLNRDQRVIEESRDALERFGTGMGTSAAASGMTDMHLEFEAEFAELTGKPSACLFPTGYTANVGVIAGLLGPNDVVVIDQLCHASIVDGARLCGATIRTFQHNNAEDLESVLESEVSPYRTVLVVLEGVYSMGEGAAPVAEIVGSAKKYGALVLVDEAHSFGFYGPRGAGICADQGVTEQVDFIMTTLSKALGSLGGVIAASKEHVDLLKSSARAYIFQASISPADMAAALTSLRRIRSDDSLRDRLWDTTRYMRAQFTEAGYDLGTGDGPIVTPHFGDKDKLYALVQGLYKRGVQTSAVTYPIVEVGRGRLRLICSASHTRDDVDKTLAALVDAEREIDAAQITAEDDAGIAKPNQSAVDDWANAFAVYLQEAMADAAAPAPNLTVMIKLPDSETPTCLLVEDRLVTISSKEVSNLPVCTLLLKDHRAVSALSNVGALLQSICQGTCVLKGEIEPFIWLIGRMVDQQNMKTQVNEHRLEEACC